MRRIAQLALMALMMLPVPAVARPPAPSCAEAPCRVCFVVSEAMHRAGGEPVSCAA